MLLVGLKPGEMSRDVEGLRASSVTLSESSWVELSEAELATLKANPILEPRLVVIEVADHKPTDKPLGKPVQELTPASAELEYIAPLPKKQGKKQKG